MPDTIFAGLNMPNNMGYLQIKMIKNGQILDNNLENDPHNGPIIDICFVKKQGMKILFTCANDGLRCFIMSEDNQ